jgi:flavin reductase (DIM6/NTAB) family NADH-FMN oxidoreductase RutF
MTIDPREVHFSKVHGYLLSAVVPRPIAFASTIDREGNVNLSPFSFFNCFGANPPILVFSPSRRGRDNTTKHSFENVKQVPEVVINIVNYSMVHQASVASGEYPKEVNEFIKAGFTEVPSERVKPPRVGESPASFECRVLQVIPTGQEGGAGNLVVCEVILMHIKDEILGEDGKIDPFRLDAVARMGGDWYCRANGESLFRLPQPGNKIGIGVDRIPDQIRMSNVLTGNDLGQLASVQELPGEHLREEMKNNPDVRQAASAGREQLHLLAQAYLRKGLTAEAWAVLLAGA